MGMHTSAEGIAAIKQYEKLELDAYQDATGTWTIGYGHTASAGSPIPQPGMTVTADSALRLLMADIATVAEAPINQMVTVALNQNQFDALASLVFNIGGGNFHKSSLLRALNAGNFVTASADFALWNTSKGQILSGLTNRRASERKLFDTPVTASAAPAPAPSPSPVAQPSISSIPDVLTQVGDTLNNIFTGGSTAPAKPAPSTSTTTKEAAPMFNITTITSIFSLVQTYGPKVAAIVKNFPDIEAKAKDAIAKAKLLDLQGVELDIEAILTDVGLNSSVLTQSLMAAEVLPPDAPTAKKS